MDSKNILSRFNIPFMMFAIMLVTALSGIMTIILSQPTIAKQYQYNAMSVRDDYCYSAAAKNQQLTGFVGGAVTNGLINAVMNVPIYDWDQGDQANERTLAYRAYNVWPYVSFVGAGLRGPQKGLALGYAEKFDFKTQMVPSLPWMVDYIGRQLPVDVQNLARTAQGGGISPAPNLSPSGRVSDPYIANPFIYTQGAILDKNGMPRSPLATNLINGSMDLITGNGSIESVVGIDPNDPTGFLDPLVSQLSFNANLLSENDQLINGLLSGGGGLLSTLGGIGSQAANLDFAGLAQGIQSGQTASSLVDSINSLANATTDIETAVENFAGTIAGLPGISHATALPYSVDGTRDDENDLCYEDVSGRTGTLQSLEQMYAGPYRLDNVPQVPAYAFSMTANITSGLGSFIPYFNTSLLPVPGILYSIIMLADPVTAIKVVMEMAGVRYLSNNNRMSTSGFDFALGGSLNQKDMLDCFGKGTTRTLWMHDKLRFSDFDYTNLAFLPAITEWMFMYVIYDALGDLINKEEVSTPWASRFRYLSLTDVVMNTAIAAAIRAAGDAAISAASSSGGGAAAAPAIRAAVDTALQLPAVWMAYENYYAYVPLFNVDKRSVQLPERFKDRVIAYDDDNTQSSYRVSKTTDINLGAFLAADSNKGKGLNHSQFNPDVFLKLKEPYVLKESVNIGANERQLQDGTELDIDVSALKHGFAKGNTRISTEGDKYREDETRNGGPTFNDSRYGDGRSFTDARVYEIIMQPGVSPNAIDADRVEGDTKTYYDSIPVDSNGNPQAHVTRDTNPCEFLAQQLRDGDPGARTSSRTPGGSSNANKDIEGVPEISNQTAGTEGAPFTCEMLHEEPVRMTADDKEKELVSLNRKIPAETLPGTKYCYAVYFNKYTNDLKTQGEDWWDGSQHNYSDYNTPEDTTYLSRAHCVISGYRPSFQVRGGDLMVDGGIYTGTNTKEWLEGEEDSEGDKPKRTYGSWAEYGVLASGSIRNIASGGLYRTGLIPGQQDFGYLTFSNKRTDSRPDYGEFDAKLNDGFDDVAKQFTAMSGQATALNTSAPIYVDQLESGVYLVPDETTATVEMHDKGQPLDRNKSIIILVGRDATVNIADNITTPTHYASTAELSQVVFAPANNNRYRLNIQANVTQLDAWIVNPLGVLNTCTIPGVDVTSIENTPRGFDSPCHNELLVNGPVSAGQLVLRRSGGHDQDRDGLELRQSIPAETFNLRPDSYLWVANYVDDAGKKYITTNAIDLPPRY